MLRELKSSKFCVITLLNITLFTFFIFYVSEVSAIPAYPKFVTVVQPDGSTLEIKKHGDEFFNWTTTRSGHAVMQKNGYYYYVEYDQVGKVRFSNQRATQTRSSDNERRFISKTPPQKMASIASTASDNRRNIMMSTMGKAIFPSKGNIKSIILLVEFQDVRFKITDTKRAFTNLLNQKGYSNYNANGSAKDYFLKSSGGKFVGQFDVAGPYLVSGTMARYGRNRNGSDIDPRAMVEEAAILADREIDFSQYDYDNDGIIDNVFIYYAGYNEAEYGPDDSIWPHKWAIRNKLHLDGKRLSGYACSSELRGNNGLIMAGIGTFCHEFSHVFGLSDHYDTNGSTDGYSYGLGQYDVMTIGSYNNFGNTPPLFNALEMEIVGWAKPKLFDGHVNDITLKPIDYNDTYKILTEVEGEYYLIENRQQNDPNNIWDKYIPSNGLIITYVNRSSSKMRFWNLNKPNGNSNDECFKFVFAGNTNITYDWRKVPYPYSSNNEFTAKSSPAAVSGAGVNIPHNIFNIRRDGLNIKFDVLSLNRKSTVKGTISDSNGDVVSNAVITFNLLSEENKSHEESNIRHIVAASSNGNGEYLVETASGKYNMTIFQQGYSTYNQEVNIKDGINKYDIKITKSRETPMILIDKYEYSIKSPLDLKMINLNDDDTVIWQVNGVKTNDLRLYPNVGNHTIKAEVTSIDNMKYIVIKQIRVK